MSGDSGVSTEPAPDAVEVVYSTDRAVAILEIGLRVGAIPFNVTSRHVLLTIHLSFTHKEFRSLFNELYLLYFVQNFA